MKFIAHQCEICKKIYPSDEFLLLKMDFKQEPVIISRVVEEWHCGIRVICKYCINEFKKLEIPGEKE